MRSVLLGGRLQGVMKHKTKGPSWLMNNVLPSWEQSIGSEAHLSFVVHDKFLRLVKLFVLTHMRE